MHLGVLEQEGLRVELTTATNAAELNEKLLNGSTRYFAGGGVYDETLSL